MNAAPRPNRAQLCDWLTRYLAQLLEVDPGEIDRSHSFELYGLDSTAAVGLSGDLSDLFGASFEPSLAYEYPTIDALADHLVEQGLVVPDAGVHEQR